MAARLLQSLSALLTRREVLPLVLTTAVGAAVFLRLRNAKARAAASPPLIAAPPPPLKTEEEQPPAKAAATESASSAPARRKNDESVQTIHLRDLKEGGLDKQEGVKPMSPMEAATRSSPSTSKPSTQQISAPAASSPPKMSEAAPVSKRVPAPSPVLARSKSAAVWGEERLLKQVAEQQQQQQQPAVMRTPPKRAKTSASLLKRTTTMSLDVPDDGSASAAEMCLGGCKGSPGKGGLTADAWLLSLSEEERAVETPWFETLTSEQFRVLRMKGTEEINTGEYNDTTAEGTYACAACNQPLYTSKHKFQSGHGWPAFCDNLPSALTRHAQGRGGKVEIVCSSCGGHVGHVFKSSRSPPPKRERHCVNSVSLRFVPAVKAD